MPVTERLSLRAKSDHRGADLGLTASAQSSTSPTSSATTGAWPRACAWTSAATTQPIVPLTQEQGERTDAVVQVGYDSEAPLEHVRLRAGHAVDRRRSRGERSRRHGRLVPNRGAREDRRRGLERRLGRRRQAPHELPAQRSHDVVLELRARERAHRQRLARHARQRRQHRCRRQDAAVGQHAACISRSAIRAAPPSRRVSRTRRASAWRPRSGSISVRAPTSARCATR